MKGAKRRHIAKTITWRFVASCATFVMSYLFFSDDPDIVRKASSIVLIESGLKMALYYLHERAWYKTKFGIK